MDVSLIEFVLYGVVSGFTEFMPVSSHAHRKMLLTLFGNESSVVLLDLFVHIGLLVALLASVIGQFKKGAKEYALLRKAPRRRKREPNMQQALDYSFVRTGTFILLIGAFLFVKTSVWFDNLNLLALFLALNGFLLFIPTLASSGNKDSRNMNTFDAILFGVGGMLCALPGISCIGASSSMALLRGADRKEAYKWSLMLCVPALSISICMDLYGLFVTGVGGMGLLSVLMCLLSCCTAYFSGALAIKLMKTLVANKGFSGFCYYSWGAALFLFILYLY